MPDGGVTFDRNKASGLAPITISCGQCYGCRMEKSRQWAVRLMHEAQTTKNGETCFITLTYDRKNLPPDHSLKVNHWQEFCKSLRYNMSKCTTHDDHKCKACKPRQSLRFLHSGEYGEPTPKNKFIARPHYHAALFGVDFRGDWREYERNKQGDMVYESKTLTDLWGKGMCTVGNLTHLSAGYIAGYMLKKITGEKADEHYEKVGLEHDGEVTKRKPEYATMSLRPGLGRLWIERNHGEVYPRDEVISQGHPARPPAYYDRYLKEISESDHKQLLERRRKAGNARKEEQTPERLAIRERVHMARLQHNKRETL